MEQRQLRELLDLAVEGADYVQSVFERGLEDPATTEILDQLQQVARLVEQRTEDTQGLLQDTQSYAKNVQSSLDEMARNSDLRVRIMSCEIRPFFIEMRRLWLLATEILPSKSACAERQARIFQQMKDFHGEDHTQYKYKASIVLTGFNKLEYTKKAAESIFAHTDFSAGNIELITIDNGSSDGTKEFFESLPHEKKIHLTHNIMGGNSYFHIVEGKYIVTFSNDVVATPRWLDNMLAAMESDRCIAIAVPTCNEASISNDQGIPVPYPNTFEGMEQMQEFAEKHNHSNPALWEQRPLLMPFVAIIRRDICLAGLTDPIYTSLEFSDDDMSTLLRRTGWCQYLLKDTFLHHFGGVTLGEGRKMSEDNNPLLAMRRVYYDKWGVDAWESRGDFLGADDVISWIPLHPHARVLVLEPKFGGFSCRISNYYRWENIVPHMTAAVFDKRYVQDTGYLFDETICVDCVEDLRQVAGGYDLITSACYLDEFSVDNAVAFFERLYALLSPQGRLIVPVRNPACARELWELMMLGGRELYNIPGETRRFSGVSVPILIKNLREHPTLHNLRTHAISCLADEALVEHFRMVMKSLGAAVEEKGLSWRMVFIGIQKEDLV